MGLVKPIGALERSLNKEALIHLAESDAHSVISSDQYDLLKVYVEMKRYDLYFKTVLDKIREAALVKAQATGKKSFNYADAQISNIQRSVYKFDRDPTWSRLHDAFELLKSRLKQHEEILRKIDGEKTSYLDEETGELIELIAPSFEIVETIMVKI